MRVVGGEFGSRPIKAVPGKGTRPTSDKVRESIFNLIRADLGQGNCLDFYAGSGALGIEAVSRGMDLAVLCEKHPLAIKTIQGNVAMTQQEGKFVILKGNNRKSLEDYLKSQPSLTFSLIFLDPPYAKEHILEDINWLEDMGVLEEETLIVCETDRQHDLPQKIGRFNKFKDKKYGQTQIHVFIEKE